MKGKLRSLFDIKMLKFLLVGVVNTLFGTTLMFVLYNCWLERYGDRGYWISSAANYFFGSILSYFLNKYFTFRNHERGWKPLLRFALSITVCYLLAYGAAKPLVRWLLSGATANVRNNVAMLTGMCLFVGLNYLGQRLFAFREPKNKEQASDT